MRPDTVSPDTISEPAPGLRDLAAVRSPDDVRVRVVPADPERGSGPRVLVVVEDMPHLIDSVIAELRHHRLVPDRVVHPRVRVRRDVAGVLVDHESSDTGTVTLTESWTSLELDGPLPGPREALEAAVEDRVVRLRAHLRRRPGLSAQVRDLAVAHAASGRTDGLTDFLLWCRAGNMHLLDLVPCDGSGGGQDPLLIGWRAEVSDVVRDERPLRVVVPPTRPGEPAHELIGLLTDEAARTDPRTIPVLGAQVQARSEDLGISAERWSGRRSLELLREYPRSALLHSGTRALDRVLGAVPGITDRRRLRVVAERDGASVVTSVLVFLGRDRCTPDARETIRREIEAFVGGPVIEHSVAATASAISIVHLTTGSSRSPAESVEDELETRLTRLLGSWEEQLAALGGTGRPTVVFPPEYRAAVTPSEAAHDLARLGTLDSDAGGRIDVAFLPGPAGTDGAVRWQFRLYSGDERIALSAVLPVLHSLGLYVLDEHSWPVARGRDRLWVHHFDVRARFVVDDTVAEPADRLGDTFVACWTGECDVDGFNRLVGVSGLDWRQARLLRALARYLQQIGHPHGPAGVADTLCAHPAIASRLVALFEARFAPETGDGSRTPVPERLRRDLVSRLDTITARDADRMLRSLFDLVLGVVRTNHHTAPRDLALKLDPARLPEVPLPRPVSEIFVFSTAVEGVHLRFDRVARGGLRWSDRSDDYRTEVLGLAKAQTLKNAVVVPGGAKGGFVSRTEPGDGSEHYRRFVTAMLDVVDDRAPDGAGEVRPLLPGVRHDGDDDYLVVAADKGTARFSDLANEIAAGRGYWLGDTFASGGRTGYDHKAMGITARGAWESLRRHLHERGVDADRDALTVVGIGDMSGDVFGNGMLLSPALRLVAAFDHRHVFLDPEPDPDRADAERRRLSTVPGSSWDDYDRTAISAEGGVWPRSAKWVPIGPRVRHVLGLSPSTQRLDPPALIRAILRAPVDLLWNGGVGTYVKASHETHGDVGNRACDDLRVDAAQLRAAVVVEGGNLGLTSAGRVEFAAAGGGVNTDALDNSAGVSCSDHEVNIKIAVDELVRAGSLAPGERDGLLADMTDEVAALVLGENARHNTVVGLARRHAHRRLGRHAALLAHLEQHHGLDRSRDVLPSVEEIERRLRSGAGLTSPELCTLLGRTKLALSVELAASDLPDDDALIGLLPGYFPAALTERNPTALTEHPLRRQIVVSALTNHVVDSAGMSFCHRLADDTGASWPEVVRAHLVTSSALRIGELQPRIAGIAPGLPCAEADELWVMSRRLLERGTRWLLQHRPRPVDLTGEIARLTDTVPALLARTAQHLHGAEADRLESDIGRFVDAGVPDEVARQCVGSAYTVSLLDIAEIARGVEDAGGDGAEDTGAEDTAAEDTAAGPDGRNRPAALYFGLAERLDAHRLMDSVRALRRSTRAELLARAHLRDLIYDVLRTLTRRLASAPGGHDPHELVASWEAEHIGRIDQLRYLRREFGLERNAPDLASTVAVVQQLHRLIG
ncbi:NAD-glutamate dehydrogenase domain-containing protein [Pseudonocardia sp. ICBG1293]|uniref:NAD-glutamate dehydrogenase domain-containing protein n=1 Tax=Pseudonocardia sp. ICBG1293 TaxID=2844382 RepID=UPI001CCA6837|nr:NAD-glutamate dehydrogenase domain-containing protein [Pseudonocardia sp. ICBG1293]